jgi:hypothetical protein
MRVLLCRSSRSTYGIAAWLKARPVAFCISGIRLSMSVHMDLPCSNVGYTEPRLHACDVRAHV